MISSRIDKICSLVDKRVVAEIGCDHALITKKLLESNKIDFCFLSDISKSCLNKAIVNLKDFSDKTTFFVADGLLGILSKSDYLGHKTQNFEPEQIIIAGMGGKEIVKIMQQDKTKLFKYFILQPQKNVDEVRRFLSNNCFRIDREVIAKEGKMFYNVLKVSRTNNIEILNDRQIVVGKFQDKDKDEIFRQYIQFNIDKCQRILNKKNVEAVKTKLALFEEKGED